MELGSQLFFGREGVKGSTTGINNKIYVALPDFKQIK